MASEWQNGSRQADAGEIVAYSQPLAQAMAMHTPAISGLPLPAGSERLAFPAIRIRPATLSAAPGEQTLARAYAACTAVIREHSKSFYFGASLLPAAKRRGVMALYAYCRRSDDLVDLAIAAGTPREESERQLDRWADLCRPLPPPNNADPVLLAWADTRRRHQIPQALPDELLAGVRMDLTISRYATWGDLWMYCYRVASTVGQMSMCITGAVHSSAANYAIRLGVALQLTNILRDVGEDARTGRIYLPLEDLAAFGYSSAELLDGTINDRFVDLMRFQIARARALYAAAWPGIALLAPDSRLSIAMAAVVYRGILDKIEENCYDVFSKRAHLSSQEKLALLPRTW